MKDILTGIIIILMIFLIGDLIYSEKNTCIRNEPGKSAEFCKCGLLKERFDINFYLFDRYW